MASMNTYPVSGQHQVVAVPSGEPADFESFTWKRNGGLECVVTSLHRVPDWEGLVSLDLEEFLRETGGNSTVGSLSEAPIKRGNTEHGLAATLSEDRVHTHRRVTDSNEVVGQVDGLLVRNQRASG